MMVEHGYCRIFVMMMNQHRLLFRLLLIHLLIICSVAGSAQDTLPGFSAEIKAKNRVLISWTNPYGAKIKQLSIQRSKDSLRMFKSVVTLPDPTVLQNGYMDQNLPDTNFFYRIYIMFDGGEYLFSPAKRPRTVPPAPKPARNQPNNRNSADKKPATNNPVTGNNPAADQPVPSPDTAQIIAPKDSATTGAATRSTDLSNSAKPNPKEPAKTNTKEAVKAPTTRPEPAPEKLLFVKKGDELVATLNEKSLKRFRDSILTKTKDTLSMISRDTLLLRPFQPREVFTVSKHVFMDKTGLLHIEFPWYAHRNYQVRFFDTDRSPLFVIKDIKDPVLLLDKANFMRAGWYFFEVYEDGKLLEKNKIFVPRDF
jgi:hypothetical protein